MNGRLRRSKKSDEFVNGDSSKPNKTSYQTDIEFTMKRDRQWLVAWIRVVDETYVAPFLSHCHVAYLFKRPYCFRSADSGYAGAHTSTATSLSRVVAGSGQISPRSFMTSRHRDIASRMFSNAAGMVSPWLKHPVILGHSATKKPLSPFRIMTG